MSAVPCECLIDPGPSSWEASFLTKPKGYIKCGKTKGVSEDIKLTLVVWKSKGFVYMQTGCVK